MIDPQVMKRIREIEIHTRRALSGTQVGDFSTAQKGSGFEFDQIRAYQHGDDVRFIDWKSTARTGKMLVRQYLEERNRTIWLCCDISLSMQTGSAGKRKSDVAQEIAAVFAFIAEHTKDNVGVIFFSDVIHEIIPPGRGRKHLVAVISRLYAIQPRGKGACVQDVLHHIMYIHKSPSIICMISDYIDVDLDISIWSLVQKKHDCILIRCLDMLERTMHAVGTVWGQDPETGVMQLLATDQSMSAVRNVLNERLQQQNQLLKKRSLECIDVTVQKPFIKDIVSFFRKRMLY